MEAETKRTLKRFNLFFPPRLFEAMKAESELAGCLNVSDFIRQVLKAEIQSRRRKRARELSAARKAAFD